MGGQGHYKHSMERESRMVQDGIRRGIQGQKNRSVGFVDFIVEV
jgi:hypothetical protein